jgi:hypothetical protein
LAGCCRGQGGLWPLSRQAVLDITTTTTATTTTTTTATTTATAAACVLQASTVSVLAAASAAAAAVVGLTSSARLKSRTIDVNAVVVVTVRPAVVTMPCTARTVCCHLLQPRSSAKPPL